MQVLKISTKQAKRFAHFIKDEIVSICDENIKEYISFLESRQSLSENARKELKRIKGEEKCLMKE